MPVLANYPGFYLIFFSFLCIDCMQYSLFGSILTFGAMVGAITSGPIADFIGRKGVNSEKL